MGVAFPTEELRERVRSMKSRWEAGNLTQQGGQHTRTNWVLLMACGVNTTCPQRPWRILGRGMGVDKNGESAAYPRVA